VLCLDLRAEPDPSSDDEFPGEPTHSAIRARGGDAAFLATDVSAPAQVDAAADAAVSRWGRLDVWVNNAGIAAGGSLLDVEAGGEHGGVPAVRCRILHYRGRDPGGRWIDDMSEPNPNAGPQVDPAVYERIGQVTRRLVSDPVSLRGIREYLVGTGESAEGLPRGDEPAAISEVVAPPLYFLSACREVVGADQLAADGQHRDLGVDGVTGRSMMAGSKAEFLGELHVGDVLFAEERLASVTERSGRSGDLVFVETVTDYTNQLGNPVARYRMTVVFR
jgi:hypothetical protein